VTIAAEHRQPMPSTALADAFLRTLMAWAARQHGGRVTLPSGNVDGGELVRVVLALLRAQSDSKASRHIGA
jgi:hypothetical protein